MSKVHNSSKSFSNALALGTLTLLLGAIFLTISSNLHEQQTQNKAETLGVNTTPSYAVGNITITEYPTLTPTTQVFITPTVYCVGGNGAPPCASFSVAPSIEPTTQTPSVGTTTIEPAISNPCEPNGEASIQSRRRDNRNGLIGSFFGFIFDLIGRLINQPSPTPTAAIPSTAPSSAPSPTVNPCPSASPTASTSVSEAPSIATTTTISPTTDPCDTTASVQDEVQHRRRERNSGFFSSMFEFFFKLIETLLRNLQGQQPTVTPVPSITPSEAVSPTLNPCVSVTPNIVTPSVNLTAVPSVSVTVSSSPTTTVSASPAVSGSEAPSPTINPCDTSASVQDGGKRHRKHGHGRNNGWISRMFEFLFKFLQLLISKLPNQNPDPSNPSPSLTPTVTPSVNPCVSTAPSIAPSNSPSITVSSSPTITTAPSGVLLVTPTVTPPVTSGTGTTLSVQITFYGAYDNDPKGSRAISNPVLHEQAGGTGTYQDPLTFASPTGTGEYAVGQKIYVPLVQKYFIREDTCATSWTAPNGCGAVSHVDLYMGNPSDSETVLACEEKLTPSGNATIIVNPPANLTVDPNQMWNQSTGTCMTPHK